MLHLWLRGATITHHYAPATSTKRKRVRLRVFVSYAHRDEKLRIELEKHLSALKRSALIESWQDRKLVAGAKLDREILEHLRRAHVVLLLISPDFINSDYCYQREMREAIRRHSAGKARVIPIILRPVDWLSTPIGKLLALPKDGRPVTSWSRRDEALLDVVRGIRRVVEEFVLISSGPRSRAFIARKPNEKADSQYEGSCRN